MPSTVPPAYDFDVLTTPVAWIGADGHVEGANLAFARWLGISGRRAGRLREQAEYAIGGWPYPSLVQHIRFVLMVMRLGLEIRWRIFRSVFYG